MGDAPKLKRVKRLDSVPLEKVEYTPEWFLIDRPIVTSIGIFEYTDPDGKIRRELRLPEHVFSEKSLATYEGKPVIITHEAGRVDKDNVGDEIVGTILSKGEPDGDNVRAKIIIHDIDAVKQSNLRELSLGYDLVLDETPGEWNGQHYDAIQTEIVINHLAIVREARAGEQARLNIDSTENNALQKGANVMAGKAVKQTKATNSDDNRKKIAAYEARRKRRLDEAEAEEKKKEEAAANADTDSGVTEEIKENGDTPPTDKPTVEERVSLIKDRRDRRDADGDAADLEAAKAAIAEQDEDIEQLIEIVEELQAANDIAAANKDNGESGDKENKDEGEPPAPDSGEKPINADSVDEMLTERLKLVRIGDRLNLDGLETLKPLDAKKRIIKAIKPDLHLDGKSSHYVNTAFDIALQELDSRKSTDYQRRQMFNADGRNRADSGSSAMSARERMIDRMMNGGDE